MTFMLHSKGHYYIAKCVQVNGKPKTTIIRKASQREIDTHLINRSNLSAWDMAIMTCTNPNCDKQIKIPRKQKWKFNVTYPLRYGRSLDVYCSKECQTFHSAQLEKIEKGIKQPEDI